MTTGKEPRKRQPKRQKGNRDWVRQRLGPLALAGTVGVVAVVALVLGLGSLSGGGSGEPAGGTSKPPSTDLQRVGLLEVSDTDVDLGQVPIHQWVDQTFLVRNGSASPVTITVTKASVEILQGC